MFGFAAPSGEDQGLWYRSLYSRLCIHLRGAYGAPSAIVHSYDTLLLYACAADAKLFDSSCLDEARCCRFRRFKDRLKQPDAEIAQYCTSAGLLLASVKIEDNIRDGSMFQGLLSRAARALLRTPFHRMQGYFTNNVPSLRPTLENCIKKHLAVETHPTPNLTLAEYVKPTAEGFGHLFSALPSMLNRTELESQFRMIGELLGSALIAFDCAVDWREDKKNGDFNLVTSEEEAVLAFSLSDQNLEKLHRFCTEQFGADSKSAQIALLVRKKVLRASLGGSSLCAIPKLGIATRIKQAWSEVKQSMRVAWDEIRGHQQQGATLYICDPCTPVLACLCAVVFCNICGTACCSGPYACCAENSGSSNCCKSD